MLRVWNKVTNSMVDALDRPILRWKSTTSRHYREPDTSDESDVSRSASDDDSPSSESMKDAGVTDGSDDSDHSNEVSDDEDSDIPRPEPIVYQVVSTANGGKKGNAESPPAVSTTGTTATPTATNLPPTATTNPLPVISAHNPIPPPPHQLLDTVNLSGTSRNSEVIFNETSSESENESKSGNKPAEESVKQSNQEELSKKKEQATKEELPLPPSPPPTNPTPVVAIVAPSSQATPVGIPKPTHIPVTAESLAAARLKVAAEKKAVADAAAAKLVEEERKKDEKIELERKKKEDAAALEREKRLEHERLVAAEAAKKVELEQKKAAERRRKAEDEKKAKVQDNSHPILSTHCFYSPFPSQICFFISHSSTPYLPSTPSLPSFNNCKGGARSIDTEIAG